VDEAIAMHLNEKLLAAGSMQVERRRQPRLQAITTQTKANMLASGCSHVERRFQPRLQQNAIFNRAHRNWKKRSVRITNWSCDRLSAATNLSIGAKCRSISV
jgi:hypothetical protein